MTENSITEGDQFMAIIRQGKHSKTLAGVERAGKEIPGGPFLAKRITYAGVETTHRIFRYADFILNKLGAEK